MTDRYESMKIDEAVSILRAHNEWRRAPAHLPDDARPAMGDPRKIGIAIDTVCDALEAPVTQQIALQVIRTWAAFELDNPEVDALVPEHVLKICDEALGIDQARGKESGND